MYQGLVQYKAFISNILKHVALDVSLTSFNPFYLHWTYFCNFWASKPTFFVKPLKLLNIIMKLICTKDKSYMSLSFSIPWFSENKSMGLFRFLLQLFVHQNVRLIIGTTFQNSKTSKVKSKKLSQNYSDKYIGFIGLDIKKTHSVYLCSFQRLFCLK